MSKFFFALMVVAACAFAWNKWKAENLHRPTMALQNLAQAENFCTNRNYCVMVYVAPWCPTCQKFRPRFQKVLGRANISDEYGIRIVVGLGATPADNAAEAAIYGTGTTIDQDGSIRKAFDINSYPGILVLDKEQNVILRGQAALDKMMAKFYPDIPAIPESVRAQAPAGALLLPQF